ncbi:MAG: aldehyde dehydrogenase family protein [Thermoproteota archaeon]|nr:aldehyde dehydrogenase family protein [Candidatus Brockarchaeota archaeon]
MLEIKPFCSHRHTVVEKTQNHYRISEISCESMREIINKSPIVQERLSKIGIGERLRVIGEIGKVWREKLNDGRLEELKKTISRTTGYGEKLIEMEFSLIPMVLSRENIFENLSCSPAKSILAFERFVEMKNGESFRIVPAGPVFIISSGNSLLPAIIPSTISLAAGNLTIVKPSLSNYLGVVEAYKALSEIASNSEEAEAMMDGLVISYFTHESDSLKYLLSGAKLGVVNFWGGEPARTSVARMVSENPHHPKMVINGPLTGCVLIDEKSADEKTAEGLARNIILYDQQLCSSPTSGAFIGSWTSALSFTRMVERFLNQIGLEFESDFNDASIFLTQSARRVFQLKGSHVISSKNPRNFWTLVVSKGESVLDEVVNSLPAFSIYARRRFLELVVVSSVEEALEHIRRIPLSPAFKDVDGVQTVGYSMNMDEKILEKLVSLGVYRVVPLSDMFMRSPIEPYDGVPMLSAFTKIVYRRDLELFKP